MLVTEVTPGSPAERAGFRQRDIIVRVADATVLGVDDLQRALTDEMIGRTTDVVVLRDGVQKSLTLLPEERSEPRAARGSGVEAR